MQSVNKEQATQTTLLTLSSTQHKFNIFSTFIFKATHTWYILKYQTSSNVKILQNSRLLSPNRISISPTLQGYLVNNPKKVRAWPILCFYDFHFYICSMLIRCRTWSIDSKYDFCEFKSLFRINKLFKSPSDAPTIHWVWYDAQRSGFWPSLKVLWR